MRIVAVVAAIVLFGLARGIIADDPAKPKEVALTPNLTVAIAVPEHNNHHSLDESDHFHVLLTNTSKTPLRLWTDRYSWGYANLSFETIDDAGNVAKVSKKARGWDKNFPDWLALGPGESYVLNVDFFSAQGREIWNNAPGKAGGGAKPKLIKMRAIYEIQSDKESQDRGVWTGKAESPVGQYATW